jgi:hypothetical protein
VCPEVLDTVCSASCSGVGLGNVGMSMRLAKEPSLSQCTFGVSFIW